MTLLMQKKAEKLDKALRILQRIQKEADDSDIQIASPSTGKSVTLEGSQKTAFRAGIQVAIELLQGDSLEHDLGDDHEV